MSETTDAPTQEEFEKATSAELDEADIDKDRAVVGRDWASRSQEFLSTATPEAIRNFATGYGDDNPLFTDPDYGRGTRWGGQIAPPIMAAILNAPLRGERPSKQERGGSYRGIHAFVSGGTWDWYRPIRPGDTIYSFGGLESVELKRSEFAGRSVVKVNRQVKMNQNAEVVGVYRTLVIYTERKKARERGKYKDIADPSYTDEDLAKIEEIYAAEQPRGSEVRYFEDVQAGEELPPMAKGPLTTTDMIVFHAGGYGFVPYGLKTGRLAHRNRQRIAPFYIKNEYGVPDVAQRVHWDSAWAQAIGTPRAYDYGVLRECWAHHYLTDWAGDDGWVVSQHDEIRKFNYQGDTHFLSGEVTGKSVAEDGRCLVDIAFRGTNQRGEDTVKGTAAVALPSREHGPALLPGVPAELQRKAVEMMSRHGELLREGRP
ncbi:acyl dehydratase [Actinomadura sp. GC306]|uniref:FAS1-like dehydratase domain-containing protein n=1 Tax=Actinomadura sp. GC306 TaxID=2530367 RepID=UPI001052197F|nr:MaoC family dehydratase N-terminal domain-containing protein [Actinomadura sp. GC306]TDC72022.1 acyl dehydratase [Actinomadura sp. GC306]